jgi:hypothetical protein
MIEVRDTSVQFGQTLFQFLPEKIFQFQPVFVRTGFIDVVVHLQPGGFPELMSGHGFEQEAVNVEGSQVALA